MTFMFLPVLIRAKIGFQKNAVVFETWFVLLTSSFVRQLLSSMFNLSHQHSKRKTRSTMEDPCQLQRYSQFQCKADN